MIENAEAGHSRSSELGETVLYACTDGLTKTGGDSRLTCALSEDKKPEWSGNLIQCSASNNSMYKI